MDIRPIKTNEDYEMALSRLGELMDARRGTPQGDELDILATLVDAYESQMFPIKAPDPVAAILFRMEQMGYYRRDLEPFIGTRARVSEVLNRRRNLSIRQIKRLHAGLNISLESLIGDD